MNMYLPTRMLVFSSLIGITLVFFVGCGSKPERNPLSPEHEGITKEEKVRFIAEAVARVDKVGSNGNKYPAPFSQRLAPLRSEDKNTYETWNDPDYNPWTGPDLDGWYTVENFETGTEKWKFTRIDGQIIMYPAKSPDFYNRVLQTSTTRKEDYIIRSEIISKYTTPSGKMYDFYHIWDDYFITTLNESSSTLHSTYGIGTVTIPLNDHQRFYRISITTDRATTIRERPDAEDGLFALWEINGKTTFTTSENWKGELTYSSSESFTNGNWKIDISGKGDIEDQTGTKIATVYYEQGRPGSDYYYIMLDDPTRKRHELDI